MLKVGFDRHFHKGRYAYRYLVVLSALLLMGFSGAAQPTFKSDPVETGTYGTFYSYDITTDYGGDVAFDLVSTAPGLTLADHGDGTATLSGVPTSAGTYSVSIRARDALIFLFQSTQEFDLVIAKAPLQVTAENTNRLYGDPNPVFTFTYSGFIGSDGVGVLDALPGATTLASGSTPVGTATITPSGGGDNNYVYQFHNGTLTINQAPLIANANNFSQPYFTAIPTLTITYDGLKNGETGSVINNPPALSTTATQSSNAGSYPITISGGSATNYYFSAYNDGTLLINKRLLTAKADDVSRTYGSNNPGTFTIGYTGFVNGETASVILTPPTASTAADITSHVGTYPITVSVAGANDENYTFTPSNGTLSVTKATITAKADDKSRPYFAANPPFTITYTGFVNGETEAVLDVTRPSATSLSGSLSNAGTYAITVSGGTDDNYTYAYQSGTLTVTKIALTAKADNTSRGYGANNPSSFTITYTGFVNGETAAVILTPPTASTAAVPSSPVGPYAITVSVAGATDENYTFTPSDGVLTVNKATLTITADSQTRAYGANNAPLTFSYSGFVLGETTSVIEDPPTISTTATNTSPVAVYPVTLTGGSDTNYTFNLVNGSITVTKATITATADNKTRPYGSPNPPLTVSYSGFLNGDTEAVFETKPTATTSADVNSHVNSYQITAAGGVDNNYTFNYVQGSLSVTKVSLTATAEAKSRVYGIVNPPLTFTYSGFLNSDNAASIDTPPSAATTALQSSPVGDYPITLSGGVDNDYDIVLVGNTLTITKATLTITAQNQTRTYGAANPELTVSYSGFANGDTPAVFTTPLVVTTPAIATSPVGTYGIVPSAALAVNYNINFTSGTLTVTKATIIATADNQSRPYGSSNPTLTITYTGFVNGETVLNISPGSATAATATSTANVGTYPIVPSGASSSNYAFTYQNGILTITQASLTATAQAATRIYGNPEPVFNITYAGFVNGQNASVFTTAPTATTDATITSNVGNYAITLSGGAALNYAFTYVPGVLSITKATLNAIAEDKSRTYGGTNPTFTVTYTGFKNSETATVVDTPPTATTTAGVSSNAGNYPITVSGGTDNNYQFTYQAGTLTIGKAVLIATADNKSRLYGAANPLFTLQYSGLLGADVAADIQTPPSMSTTAIATSVVGTYPINITGGTDENYTFNYASGTLTIGKATLTATPDPVSRAYGAPNGVLNVSYTGFANGETKAVIDVQAMASTTANVNSNVGTYDITANGASDNNYDFVYAIGTLTVTKATLTLTATNLSKVYGAANPTLLISYSGFQNGDTQAVLDAPAPAPSTTATLTSPVGSYPITISNGTDNNYTYLLVSGSLSVTKATLIVTAENKTRVYNTANPAFTLTYSGFQNGDTEASITPPTASTSATLTSAVGTYPINPSGGTSANYTFSFVPGTLTITKAMPVVTWNAPAAITYGTALSGTQLNATANVGGAFEYTPASGTVLNAGANQTLSVKFTPSDLTNYDIVNLTTTTITVNKATPIITWANPAAITYGTTLNATNHLNATASVAGTFTYTPAAGTLLNAGTHSLRVDFHPTDALNYNDVNNTTRSITVNKATPVVTWNNPASITYGTPLQLGVQLNATFSVPGTPTYVPGPGTILPTGANQAISVNFTPTDQTNYNSVNGTTVLITVIKATPVVTWATPADITYGTALSIGTQLNVVSSVPGTTEYTPAPGTILSAGANQTLTAKFTPTDLTNYNIVPLVSTTINVLKANPVITWSNPAPITYGTPLSATQLNATGSVGGTFTYNPTSGTVLNAGANQTISSTFTPTDLVNYNVIVTNRTITVNKATPVVTWANPAQITYGTPLKLGQQLNATANVPGVFDYTPGDGTILTTGANQNISVKFTPTDLANYNIVLTTTVQITVIKATPVITWSTPLPIKVGVALSATQLNATSSVPGTFNYTPAAGTSFGTDGTYTLSTAFTPADAINYNSVPLTQVQIVVSSKDNPVITWSNPAAITYGTLLSATQLNATASVPGTYSYNPASGVRLDAGVNQNLTVTFTPTDGVNYNVVAKTVQITVNKATLTATATSTSRAYGSNNPVFNIDYTGFVNSETSAVIDTKPTATCAAIASDPAGATFPIIPSGGADNNYQFNYVNGTLTINKAALTAKADNQSRAYGSSNLPFTISYTGFVNGDDSSDITQPNASTAATITSNVGSYAITLTGGSAANYTITLQSGTLTITQALLAVIGDDLSRLYGSVNPELTFKYLGFKNGDTKETAITTPPTATTPASITSGVGTYPVNISGGVAINYSLAPFPGSLTINKAPLTAKARDLAKTYGAANPSTYPIDYTGFKNSDTKANITEPTITPPAVSTSTDAGTYPILLSGGSAANYDIILANGVLTINKATLTATAENKSKTYGDVNPGLTIVYSGFVSGDNASDITPPTASTTATITSPVGPYPITLTGGTAQNYSFSLQPGTLTINKSALTARANDRTRTYGQANPSFSISYTGFKNGDDATDITPPTASTTAASTSPAGNYPITLAGGTSANYTFTLQPGTLTVSKATLIAKVEDKTRLYGAANPVNTILYTGFVNGDDATDITPPITNGPGTTPSSPVDVYPITISGGSAANYTFSLQNGTLTIEKAPLTARAEDKSRLYGGANPVFTIVYTGFVNGETKTNISEPTAATPAVVTSPVGTYPITLTGTTGNYEFNFQPGTLTVNKATVTVTAENKSRAYGAANPLLTFTYSGFVNNETATVIDTAPTATTTATNTSPVGPYIISLGGGVDNNYTFSNVSGTLTITKAALTATADNKTRPYGSVNPANTISYVGFVNGENSSNITPPTANTSATTASPVGTYPIVLSGGTASNYQLTLQNGTLTVAPAVIVVTANNLSRTYGALNPTFTFTYSGFVNGETSTVIDTPPVGATTATVTSPVNEYTIIPSGGTDSNYSFTYVNGKLTVNKAALTATAVSKTTTYGTIPPLTINYVGFVNSESASVLDTQPSITTTATVTSNIGIYPITISGATDDNYTISHVSGTMTIGKAPLIVKADDKSRIINVPNPEFTITYTGFKNNETSAVLDVRPTALSIATQESAPGTYAINVSGGSDNHYDFTYQNGSLIVVLDNPPVAKNFTIETDEDAAFPFTVKTFEDNRTDEPNGKILYVKILTLPINGTLFRGPTRIVAGEDLIVTNNQFAGDITYLPNTNYVGTDQFNWNMFDGSYLSVAPATVTIKVKPVNDPPVLSNIESTTIEYSLGDPAVLVTEKMIINDVDDQFIFSASVLIATNFTDGDELSVEGGVIGTNIESNYDALSGELQLTGKESRATYQSVLNRVAFSSPVTGSATLSNKDISITVRDSIANSNIAVRVVEITEVFPELDLVNSFTPNGDDVNDYWDILNLDGYSQINIFVYSPDGSKVFECHEVDCMWDGTNKGKALPAGPYLYTIDLNNGKRKYKGTVNILK